MVFQIFHFDSIYRNIFPSLWILPFFLNIKHFLSFFFLLFEINLNSNRYNGWIKFLHRWKGFKIIKKLVLQQDLVKFVGLSIVLRNQSLFFETNQFMNFNWTYVEGKANFFYYKSILRWILITVLYTLFYHNFKIVEIIILIN